MLDKNVCPKCGQLYSITMQKCPLCGAAAPVPDYEPVLRQRITEEERKQRQSRRRQSALEDKRRKKAEARAKKREEELFLQAEEERTRQLKKARRSGAQQPSVKSTARRQEEPAPEDDRDFKDGKIPPAFTAISAVILILAALIGISFFLWKSGKLNLKLYDRLSASTTTSVGNPPTTSPTQETPPASTEPSGLCEGITLSAETLEIKGEGETKQLSVTLEPEDCKEEVLFSSDNTKVAVVDETGTVTAVGPGDASITVTCGKQTAVCKVSCIIELELNNPDMTFFNPGESFTLKVTNADPDAEIIWTSEDESIAKVSADGRVEAVSEGTVYVTATIGGSTGKSIVRCHFD